jgi:hypothetical protein
MAADHGVYWKGIMKSVISSARRLTALLALSLAGCGGSAPAEELLETQQGAKPGRDAPAVAGAAGGLDRDRIPGSMRPCYVCHREVVDTYLRTHGMAGGVGKVGTPPPGVVVNPRSDNRYEISTDARGAWLTATFPDGGKRVQRLVGRVGRGVFDTSWVGTEVDLLTGEDTGRLFFAPVETITGHGHVLSPFELVETSPGLDEALGESCLTCHTDTDLGKLAGAAVAEGSESARHVFPPNALGASAFEEIEAPSCSACHGDPAAHLELMPGPVHGGIGLDRLGEQPAGRQRDVCARCHLQGDARIDLAGAQIAHLATPRDLPLGARIPALVPARQGDDFRFVGQLERLALSACFLGSPEMTCGTCHDPHRGVAAQGLESFEATCAGCHDCSRDPALEVAQVTGEQARTATACVDCHVRRSQPFDLPHVRSADHFIRRRAPRPENDVPHRPFADREGALEIFDDGRLAERLRGPGGERWRSGVMAMGLLILGRTEEAARHFEVFPAPGTAAARAASAPAGFVPFETSPIFHRMRARSLIVTGRFQEGEAALSDALALDPLAAGVLIERARLRFATGDVAGAFADCQTVIDNYPASEEPWELRATMAERLGRLDLAVEAFAASTERWPSNAVSWYKLGLLLEQRGESERARRAIERARLLQPSIDRP